MGVKRNVTAGIRERLAALRREIEDMDPLWDKIADIMVEETMELWATGGATANPPWPPLAEATEEKKMRQGLPLDPMVETWHLYESLLDGGGFSQGRSSLGTFTSKEFTWGTEVPYAEYHQEGDEHNPELPVRNVINVTPALIMRIHEAAEDWISESARKAGFKT